VIFVCTTKTLLKSEECSEAKTSLKPNNISRTSSPIKDAFLSPSTTEPWEELLKLRNSSSLKVNFALL